MGRPLILSCLKSGIAQRYWTLSWQRGWLNSRIPDIMTTYKILSHYTNEEALVAVKQLITAPLDLISTWLYKESLMLHVEHTGTGWLVLRLFSHLVDLGCIFRDIKWFDNSNEIPADHHKHMNRTVWGCSTHTQKYERLHLRRIFLPGLRQKPSEFAQDVSAGKCLHACVLLGKDQELIGEIMHPSIQESPGRHCPWREADCEERMTLEKQMKRERV